MSLRYWRAPHTVQRRPFFGVHVNTRRLLPYRWSCNALVQLQLRTTHPDSFAFAGFATLVAAETNSTLTDSAFFFSSGTLFGTALSRQLDNLAFDRGLRSIVGVVNNIDSKCSTTIFLLIYVSEFVKLALRDYEVSGGS